MYEINNIRKLFGEEFYKKHNVKLGNMSFFVKAVSMGLKEFPILNSVIDDEK
jgi:2-oxoglutarate dehydrogenase E2 component (dihydrolipoamide succinyltransferase)